jgi:hypothetical protein
MKIAVVETLKANWETLFQPFQIEPELKQRYFLI